jgi:hypothetical protein
MKQGLAIIILVSWGLAFSTGPGDTPLPGPQTAPPAVKERPMDAMKGGRTGLVLAQSGKQAPAETSADKPPAEKTPEPARPENNRAKPKRAPKNDPQPAPPAEPIKPFNPSEKIDADQAVDFPYDI